MSSTAFSSIGSVRKNAAFHMEAFTGISLFLETLLAFVIVLHFGMAAVLLGREMVQVLSSFLSAVSPRVSPGLGENWGQDLPDSLQPSWFAGG